MSAEGASWLTKQQAADRIGKTTKTIERLTHDGKLHPMRWRRPTGGPELVVYDPDEVDRIARAGQPGPVPAILVPKAAELPSNGNGHGPGDLARVPQVDGSQLPAVSPGDDVFHLLIAGAARVLSETSQTSPLFLTIPEAAAVSGLSQAYLRRKCQEGWAGAFKDGSTWKLRKVDLETL